MALERPAVRDACAYFDSWLAYRVGFDRVPGIQAAVLHDDELVLATAGGMADVEAGTPLTTAHRFRIASHSKTFTATAVVQLAEHGRLRLDDTVGHWLDDLAGTPLAGVTLRELLAHGGGVVRDGWDADHWQLTRPFPDAAELRRIAVDRPAVLGRNERFKYSNIGFSLLGAVIEAVTAMPYADHVQGALLDPLGLAATSPDIDASSAGDHAIGYTGLEHTGPRIPFDHISTGAMAAATGFSSTASDLVRWGAAHFHGDERVLSDDSKRLMQRTEWVVGDASGEYALGLAVADVGGRRVLGHGGGFPGFITRTWFDPVDRLAVAVLTNAIDGPAMTFANVGIRLVDLAALGSGDAPPVTRPERFTGRFATVWGVLDVAALGGRLYGFDPTLADPVTSPQRLEVVDDDTLRIADGPGYGAPGEQLRYDRQPDGSIRSVRGGGGLLMLPFEAYTRQFASRTRVHLGGI